jgi:hypothetical protein
MNGTLALGIAMSKFQTCSLQVKPGMLVLSHALNALIRVQRLKPCCFFPGFNPEFFRVKPVNNPVLLIEKYFLPFQASGGDTFDKVLLEHHKNNKKRYQ